VPGNLDLLLAFAERLADGIKGDVLPQDFLDIMHKVQEIYPDQPDALWYLGLAAQQRGDVRTASADWQRLLDHLPAGSDEHATVEQRLKSLP
jgi:cytochrome c-type biogenesis protein CcmH